jgi:NADH-quinone oxidoreductase subunit G
MYLQEVSDSGMPTIFIDNKPFDVKGDENLLKTCLGLGFDLPYFCWHPAMHSVGACRQCAVKAFKDEADTRGRIVMACMTPVSDGMRISIDDPEARGFRKGVTEWLMTNHPHDCPVCDEGGECHLQDMTVMTGHTYRRFRFKKRTHTNQDLGPFVTHEMNRCIACYRCTRFYNDYAGGTDFGVFAAANSVYFGRAESGVLESEFAGNLVEICPTGVFTDKPFSLHYTRSWDLRTAPSVCVHCGVGCNTLPGERYGRLRRIRNRYNGQVNGYFLCDRGRFGYDFVNDDKRIGGPHLGRREDEGLKAVSKTEVLDRVAAVLHSSQKVIGIGSPRASLEANFALKTMVGEDNFYSGTAGAEHRSIALCIDLVRNHPDLIPSLRDISKCDAVLVLGEDISNTAPMVGLSLLQALRQRSLRKAGELKIPYWDDRAVRTSTSDARGLLFVVTTGITDLDRHAAQVLRAAPAGVSRTGFVIAHNIDPEAPPVEDPAESIRSFGGTVASALLAAERPLVVSGVSAASDLVVKAAANIAWSLRRRGKNVRLCLVVPECNSFGLGLLATKGIDEAFAAAREGRAEVAILLENDLYRHAPGDEVDEFFGRLGQRIVVDHLFHRTSLGADCVLPAATFAEGEGTFINYEGRAQRHFQVMVTDEGIQPAWMWFRDMMASAGYSESPNWNSIDDVIASMGRSLPVLQGAVDAAPDASFRIADMKVAREHRRSSGRTALSANRTVFEPKPPEDVDSPFTFSMEGYQGPPPSPLIPRFWAPGWNSVQSVNKFQAEIGAELVGGDPGVRLFSGAGGLETPYFLEVPKTMEIRKDEVFVVPFYHVFGSEELSLLSSGIRSRTPESYLALSDRDASRFKLVDGEAVIIGVGKQSFRLTARVMAGLPSHVAALPLGIPGSPVLRLPLWVRVQKG